MVLSLHSTTFNVVSKIKITEGLNGFTDVLTTGPNPNGTEGANLGHALCKVGDLNGDGVPDLMTGANQQNEGYGYILYLNADKTVKTYTRINNTDGGFGLLLESEERFSRSISFIGDLRGDGTIAVNYGGGAGGTGTLYLMFFKPCTFTQETGNNRWSGGNILYSNWNHNTQSLTSAPLTFEQCTFKAFETDAPFMTYNTSDGRCICMDETAVLVASTELSTAYLNGCYNNILATEVVEYNSEENVTIYPNPTANNITVSTNQLSNSPQDRIQLLSILDEKLFESHVYSNKTDIDLSNYTNAIYLVRTYLNGIQKTYKVVKQ